MGWAGAARALCPRRMVKRRTEVIFDSILMHLYISKFKGWIGPALSKKENEWVGWCSALGEVPFDKPRETYIPAAPYS